MAAVGGEAAVRSEAEVRSEQERLHAGELSIGACPVCGKVFRVLSYTTTAISSIRAHIRAKAGSCEAHARFRAVALAVLPGRGGGWGCPAEVCSGLRCHSMAEAWTHFTTRRDAAHRACRARYIDAVERARLARARAAEDERRRAAERELYAVAKSGDVGAVERFVVDSGVDPNAGGEDGYTPLMTAAEAGLLGVVEFLVSDKARQRGCSLDRANRYGQTALSLAAQNNRRDVVAALLAAGVDVTLEGNAGLNAAQVARQAGHHEVANLICQHDTPRQKDILQRAIAHVLHRADFDSLQERLHALFAHTGATLPSTAGTDADKDEDEYNLSDEEAHTCVVCLSNEVEVALVPCWHAHTCALCAAALDDCPMCREKIERVQRVYLS